MSTNTFFDKISQICEERTCADPKPEVKYHKLKPFLNVEQVNFENITSFPFLALLPEYVIVRVVAVENGTEAEGPN